MTSVRRSTRLSIINKPSTPATPKSTRKTWRSKKKDDSDNELENIENIDMLRTPSQRRSIKKPARYADSDDDYKPVSPPKQSAPLLSPSTMLGRLSMDDKPEADQLKTPSKRRIAKKVVSEEEDSLGSPPKQGKFKQSPQNILSPTRLLDRLSIDEKPEDKDIVEKQAELEKKRNQYQNARRVLNSAYTDNLPGREKELSELTEFMSDHLQSMKSGSLYVSGQPGTGKTACLSKLLSSAEFKNKFSKVYINCTSMKSIGSIYKKICQELKLKVDGRKTEKDHQTAIDQYLVSSKKMVLMVLDEVDQLCGNKQAVLYTIFEWPSKQHSKLLLIGIANSLDLTDRLLLRLNANCELKPKLMHFSSYTKQQIVEIIKSRLQEAGVMEIFPPVTIQLLAAKVSAVSGDVRRALDIGRRVVEIAEQQHKAGQEINFKELGIDLGGKPAAPVQVTQVVKVLNNVYGASQNLIDDMDDNFPLQQKIMLCTLMLMLKNEKNKDITIGRLHDVYKRVCTKRNIFPVDQSEFSSICGLVETRGIIRIINKKENRLNRVQLQWDDEGVRAALMDKHLISSILEDTSCLGR